MVEVVALVEAEELPEIPFVRQRAGSGRLRKPWINHAGLPLMPLEWSFYDEELQMECFPSMGPDGALSCMPSASSFDFVWMFSDSECSTPVAVEYDPSHSCDDPTPPNVVNRSEGPSRVIPIPDPAEPLYFWASMDGPVFCVERTGSNQRYELEPLGLDELAPLYEHTVGS